jgi:shikimate kinase
VARLLPNRYCSHHLGAIVSECMIRRDQTWPIDGGDRRVTTDPPLLSAMIDAPTGAGVAVAPALAGARDIVQRLGRRSIVLVGLMGCGKSTVGRRLAQRLGIRFVDADDEIELAANKSIREIFTEHGEPYFRSGERRVIARLLRSGPQVLATGGGAYMDPETRRAIADAGIAVWLKADLPILMRRVARRTNRPLLQADDPEKVMRGLMDARYPIYAEAHLTVLSRDVSHDVMADEVLAALAGHPF